MHFPNHFNRLHQTLLYAAYSWLLLSGLLQIGIDVVSQYLRGKRAPGPSTTLYYGLNSAYGISQILFALLAFFAIRQGVVAMGQWPGVSLGLLAATAWHRPNALIVNVSSGLAFVPFPLSPIYSAAKAGMHAFSRCLQVQLKGSKVTVVELAPPGVETKLFEESSQKRWKTRKACRSMFWCPRPSPVLKRARRRFAPALATYFTC